MSSLFHTGYDSLSLDQLKEKKNASSNEKLRLVEDFCRLEAAQGECTSIEKFDKNDTFGQMIIMGLLEVANEATLSPSDRLYLAQQRYLDEELSCLIETKLDRGWTPRRVTFHKTATFLKLVKDISTKAINSNDSVIPLIRRTTEVPQDRKEGEKEEGELSDSEEPTVTEVQNYPVAETVPVLAVSAAVDLSDNAILEPPLPTDSVNQLTAAVETPNIIGRDPTKFEVGWQYYNRMKKLSDEERTAAILEVRARFFIGDNKKNLLHLMPKFDPTTDAGILITYGKLLPPKPMRISVANMKLIEAGRRLMGMAPEIPNRSKVSPKLLSFLTKVNPQVVVSEAEVKEVKQRYLLHHKGKKLIELMPVFDPTTDLGKLILWGELIPPRAMQISTLHVNQIQQMRAIRGLHPIRLYHQDSTDSTVSAATSLGAAGSSFASQLSSYQNANQYSATLHDLESAALKLSNPEIIAVEKRFKEEFRGRPNHDIMPVFDPTCDLGKLILIGRKNLGERVIVPHEYEKLLEESQAAVSAQRTRIQRLLQRVLELETTVPAAQRVTIPPGWIVLASEPPLRMAPPHKTVAEHQELSTGGDRDNKRKVDQIVPASCSVAHKRVTGSPGAQLRSEGATCAQYEDCRSDSSRSESAVNQNIEAKSTRDSSIAEIRQETDQSIPTSTYHVSLPLQPEESRKVDSAAVHFSVRNSDSSSNNTIVIKDVETEGSAEQSAASSDAEKIRAEFERMKRMYEEFISK